MFQRPDLVMVHALMRYVFREDQRERDAGPPGLTLTRFLDQVLQKKSSGG